MTTPRLRDRLPSPNVPLAAALVAGGDAIGVWLGTSSPAWSSPGWWGLQVLAWTAVLGAIHHVASGTRTKARMVYAPTTALQAWRRHEAHGVPVWDLAKGRDGFADLDSVLAKVAGQTQGEARRALVRSALSGQLRAPIGDEDGFGSGPHADLRAAFVLLVASRRPHFVTSAADWAHVVGTRGADVALSEIAADEKGGEVLAKASKALGHLRDRHAHWETAVLAYVADGRSMWGRPDLTLVRHLATSRPDLWAALAGTPPASCDEPYWLDREAPVTGHDASYPEGAGILAHLSAERAHGGPLPIPCVEPFVLSYVWD